MQFSYEGQKDEAIAGAPFEFNKEDFTGFVGQSGAGKSTLVSMLVWMYETDAGKSGRTGAKSTDGYRRVALKDRGRLAGSHHREPRRVAGRA